MNSTKNELKEYDCVELIADRDRYARHGVYKGMQGWICFAKEVEGFSLVNFPCYGDHPDIATISVRDEDLRIITKDEADDWINDRLKTEHEGKK